MVPKGLGAKGLLAALLVCPKTDGEPKGLLVDDCPKAVKNNFNSLEEDMKNRSFEETIL